MNPSWRAAGAKAQGSSVTSISVAPPSGHQSGDLLVLQVSVFGTTVSTPTGWTLFTGGDSGAWSTYRTYAFWKLATSSSEPNVTVSCAASTFPEGTMHAYQGDIDQTAPVDVSGGWAAATIGTSIPSPAVTTVTADALVVYLMTLTGNVTGTTPPNSATERYSSTFFNSRFVEADVPKPVAGTLASDNYTLSGSSNSRIFAFAVRPAAATSVSAPFVAAAATLYAPTLVHTGQVDAPFVASASSVYTPALSGAGTATLTAPYVAAATVVYTPTVGRFTAPFVAAATVVYAPTLRRKGLGAQPVGVSVGFADDAGENAPTWTRLDAP